MLYTNQDGKRLIRIINYQILVVNTLDSLYKSFNLDFIFNVMVRK